MAIRKKTLGHDHPDIAESLTNLALLYRSQGRYADAEPLYRQSLAMRQKALGPDHSQVADSLDQLALLYQEQGRYAQAEPLYQKSLAIYEKMLGPEHPELAAALNNLAGLYVRENRYSDAELLYQRSLAIREKAFGPDHPEVAIALDNLALLYDRQSRYGDAEPLHLRSLAIFEKIRGPSHPDVATALNNLGLLYWKQNRYAEAEPFYRRALAAWEKAFGRDHPDVALALNNLAALYRRQGRDADAEPLYQRSLAVYERALGRDHPQVALPLNNLAALYNRQARYGDALAIVKRTIANGSANKAVAFPVLMASQAQQLVSPTEALADSYELVQRASSTAAGAAVSKLQARFAAGTGELAQAVRRDQDLTAEAESLDKAVVEFMSKPPAQRSAAAEDAIRKRIDAVKAERETLGQIFNSRFSDYLALSKPQPVSLQETQRLLADDEALLVFDFDEKSYAWIITSTDAGWAELSISEKELAAEVQALRAWLTDPRQHFDAKLAYKIYDTTFGAFSDKIASKKRVTVVTNGALTSLPPGLLVTTDPSGKTFKDTDWLIRSHAIAILPSVASLKILRGATQSSSARRPLIAFADPIFSRALRGQSELVALSEVTSSYRGTQIDVARMIEHLPQLPGTRREVQQIAAELNAVPQDIKLGLNATEAAVKHAPLSQYRIVYFATHGLVSGDLEDFAKTKAEPALALTMPDKPSDLDDGLLTASEVAQLKLDADWAVLSACSTAAEDKPGAEALSGFARAFFYAGARSLIVSHWSVSDEAAARLMIGTFRASARDPKLSHAEALRQSMLAMLDAAKSDYEADPRFWAPFNIVGEPAKPQ